MNYETMTKSQLIDEIRQLEMKISSLPIGDGKDDACQSVSKKFLSEEKFSKVFHSSPDYISITSLTDGTIVDINEGIVRDFYYTRDEIIGKPITELSLYTNLKNRDTFVELISKNGTVRDFETTFNTKSGEKINCILNAEIIELQGEKYIVTVTRDITEKKKNEEALRESEAKFRSLIQSAPTVVLYLSPDYRILEFNAEAEKLYGKQRDDVIGKDYLTLFLPKHEIDRVKKDIDKVINGKPTRDFENYVISHDGSSRLLRWNVNRVIDSKESVAGVICTGLDITDKRKTEEELRQTQDLLLASIEQSQAGIIIADVPDGNIRIANSAALGIRGESKAPLTDIPIEEHPQNWECYYPDGKPYAPENLPLSRAILKGESPQNVEVIIRRSGSEDRWVLANASPIRNQSADITAGVVVFQDITDRKNTEQWLQVANQQLTASNEQLIASESQLRAANQQLIANQEALQESKEKYRNLYIHAQTGLARSRIKDGTLMNCNEKFAEILGYPSIEECIKNYTAEKHYKNLSDRKVLFRQLKESGEVKRFQTEAVRVDKTVRWVELSTKIIPGVDYLESVFIDIHDKKVVEEALLESEERYRTISQAAFEGLVITEKGLFKDANHAFLETFGYTNEELLDQPVMNLVAPEHREMVKERIVSGYEEAYEHKALTKDGTIIDIEVRPRTMEHGGKTMRYTAIRDITERKEAERQLQERERTLSALLNAPTESAILVDPDGTILAINEVGAQRLRKSVDDLLGLDIYSYLPPDLATSRKIFGDQVIQTGKSVRFEDHRGETYFDNNIYPVFDANGNVSTLAIYARDITDAKRTEQEKARLIDILESTSDFVSMASMDKKLTYLNKAGRMMLGWDENENIEGKEIAMVHPQWATDIIGNKAIPTALKDGIWYGETALQGIGAKEIPCSQIIMAHKGTTNGKPEYLSTIIRDITELKQAEARLKQEKKLTQQYLDVAGVMLIAINKNQEITLINRKGCEILGHPENNIIGRNWFDAFLPQDNIDEVKSVFDRIVSGDIDSVEYFENAIQRSDGKHRLIAWHNSLTYDDSGTISGIFSSGEDITERDQAERLIKESEEKYRTLFESANDAIFIMDNDTFVHCNTPTLRMFKRTEEEIIGATPGNFSPQIQPDGVYSEEKAKKKLKAALAGKPQFFEWEHYYPDKTSFYVEVGLTKIELQNKSYVFAIVRDITERKIMEHELSENEEKYRTLFESANDAIFIMDKEKFLQCNRPTLAMYGCKEKQIIGASPADFSPKKQPDGRLSMEKAKEKIIAAFAGKPQFFEWQHCQFNRTPFDAEVSLNRIELQGQALLLAIVRDVTERKKAQELLIKSERNYREIFNNTSDAIFIHDAKTAQILGVNKTMEEMYGYTSEEAYKLRLEDLSAGVYPFTQEMAHDKITAAIKEGPQTFKWQAKRKTGDIFWVEVALRSSDISGEGRVLAVVRDINDRIQMESALEDSNTRFQQIAENIRDVFFLIDKETRNILYVSPAIETIVGIPLDTIKKDPMQLADLIPPEEAPYVAFADENKRYSQPIDEEFKIIRPDGALRWLALHSVLIRDDSGEPYRVAGIVSDITNFKNAQEAARLNQQQLIQADKMASIGMMVSGVAHEINNPNNLIMLNADVLKTLWQSLYKTCIGSLKEKGLTIAGLPKKKAIEKFETMLEGVSTGSERIKNIVQNLKDFARVDAGDISESVDICEVTKSSLLMTNNLIKKATHNFSVSYGKNIPAIEGNFQKLEQVVINLISNACQSIEDKNRSITIKTRYKKKDDLVMLTIKDEGKGIKNEDLNKIMDPFFTTKRDIGGTGLGLSVSYGIIKEHNGQISFSSKEGEGTTATIQFPSYKK